MYLVRCPSCARNFDALAAEDCSCLHPARTVLCPQCSRCFCSRPEFVKKFWDDAPGQLWIRRRSRELARAKIAEPVFAPPRPIVLFADDDPLGRALAQKIVTNLGVSIVLAENGEQALRMALALKPELLIADAMMPRLDGREVARLAKQENPDLKVVVITSVYRDPRYKHEAFKQFDVDEYLVKPVSPDRLREIVTKYLPVPVP